MKCFYHEDREATATCQHCGKALCRECAALHTPCLCQECAELLENERQQKVRQAENDKRQKYLNALVDTRSEFIGTCLLGLVTSAALGLFLMQGGATGPLYFIMGFFIPFGWKLLTYLQSFFPLTIFGSLGFWLLWGFAKMTLSMMVGIPAFTYQLIKTFFAQKKISAAQDRR